MSRPLLPGPRGRACHQLAPSCASISLDSRRAMTSGSLRLSRSRLNAQAATPITAMPEHDHHGVGHPGPVPGQGRAGLGLQQAQHAEQDEQEPEGQEERAGDPHVEEAAQTPQRLDRLLLEVVDRELEGVVSRVAQPVTAVVRRWCHEAHNPGLWAGPTQTPAPRRCLSRGPCRCRSTWPGPPAAPPPGPRQRAVTLASTKATRRPPETTSAVQVRSAPGGTAPRKLIFISALEQKTRRPSA